MVQIGKTNKLTVKGRPNYGVHLDGGDLGDILLRKKDVPKNCQAGDELDVFVYRDRDDHLLATTQKPPAKVGQFANLRVVAGTASGAYLHWGLDIDLFVPKSHQQKSMVTGESYVVYVFLSEKNNRIIASSKLDKFLTVQPPQYAEGEEVDLILFEQTEMGYRAIINSTHEGMIYKSEVFQKLFVGQQLKGYVKAIREDHKIDLSLQQSGYQRVEDVSQAVLDHIRDSGGKMVVTDKSAPEEIYALFGVSKKTFKKAIGALYKKRLITIDNKSITPAGK